MTYDQKLWFALIGFVLLFLWVTVLISRTAPSSRLGDLGGVSHDNCWEVYGEHKQGDIPIKCVILMLEGE